MPLKRASIVAIQSAPTVNKVTEMSPVQESMRRVHVLLPLPLGGTYVYRAMLNVMAGAFVEVPLGRRQVTGVVWDAPRGDSDDVDIDDSRLRDIIAILDTPPIPSAMRRFVDWVAAYTVHPPGVVLRMAMSVPAALAPALPVRAFRRADVMTDLRLTPARRRVLALLADGPPWTAVEIARECGVSAGVVKGLAQAGALVTVMLPSRPPPPAPDPESIGPVLSVDQQRVAAALVATGQSEAGFSVTLLDGVTGSGKTEVYFEAMAETLRQGCQVLVLLPEIALTAQWFSRFEARFGASAPPSLPAAAPAGAGT